jgi:hypothetical protein
MKTTAAAAAAACTGVRDFIVCFIDFFCGDRN